MSSISPSAFTFNGDQTLIGNTRFQSGCPDELSPELAAEMNEHFGCASPSDESEIDRQYEAHMLMRDLDAARKAAMIELSVGMAAKGRFEARVRCGKKWHKLGKFTDENLAVLACHRKAAELRKASMQAR